MRELLYLEHDVQLAGGQVGTVAAGMAFVGAWTERRRMTRVAKAASSLAVQLAADGTPDDEAAARLLALKGTDRVALEQAARRTAGNPRHRPRPRPPRPGRRAPRPAVAAR